MDTYIARQPIFDTQERVFGYELLFRDSPGGSMPPEMDSDAATSKLLSSSFFTIGIDTITNGKCAFINFTEHLISAGIPELFSFDRTVIEVLETVTPTPAVMEALKRARSKSYPIAQLEGFITLALGRGIRLLAEKRSPPPPSPC